MSFSQAKEWRAARCAALLLVIGVITPPSGAIAGMVGLSPLRVYFDGDQQSGVVRIQNTGDDTIAMQVESRQWLQGPDGADVYEDTQDVLAVPPIFSLEPGETQLVRVGLMTEQPANSESTYRLFFTELPPPRDEVGGGQLRMRLRISMPVFVAPVTTADPELEFVSIAAEDGGVRATFRNPGNTHVRIDELKALDGNGRETQRRQRAAYLLPGTTRDFFFDSADDESITRLIAVTDTAGTREYEVAAP